jgi:spore coat polysaccharide biosynthesis protein SpsF
VVATTFRKDDDAVAACSRAEGANVIRGDEDDVLSRYMKCLSEYPSDVIIRVTADNPLTSPRALQEAVRHLADASLDYVQCRDFPYGTGVDVFSANMLEIMNHDARAALEREHINKYVLDNIKKFKVGFHRGTGVRRRPDLRMTIDVQEDLTSIRSLFLPGESEPWRITLAEAIERMDSHLVRRESRPSKSTVPG